MLYSGSIAQFNVGIQGGAGISFLTAKSKMFINNVFDAKSHINFQWLVTPVGGFFVNVNAGKKISLQSEILFENKGCNSKPETNGTLHYGESMYFIHFPEMIRYTLPVKPKSDKSFFIEAGPYFSFDLYNEDFYNGNIITLPDEWNNISRTDIGIASGIGYKQQWGIGLIEFSIKFEHSIFVQKGYPWPMHDTHSYVSSYQGFQHKVLSLTVSYSLPVKTIKKLLHPDKQKKKK